MFRVDLPPDSSWKWVTIPIVDITNELRNKIDLYEEFIFAMAGRMRLGNGYSTQEQKALAKYIRSVLLKGFIENEVI